MTLSEEAKTKSTFVTPHGKSEFTWSPFALAEVTAYFKQLICQVLWSLEFSFWISGWYLSFQTYVVYYSNICKFCLIDQQKPIWNWMRLSAFNILKAHVQCLGHLIPGQGIEPVPEKLESVGDMPSHTNVREVK